MFERMQMTMKYDFEKENQYNTIIMHRILFAFIYMPILIEIVCFFFNFPVFNETK